MNLKEIINRPNETPLDEDEAYFVLKEYVKARKGVDINPRIEARFSSLNAMREVNIMHHMLNHAIGWFRIELNKD